MNENQLKVTRLDIQQGDFVETHTGLTLRVEIITFLGFVTGYDVWDVKHTIEASEIKTNERQ